MKSKKVSHLIIRVTSQQKTKLLELAKSNNKKLSDLIREKLEL